MFRKVLTKSLPIIVGLFFLAVAQGNRGGQEDIVVLDSNITQIEHIDTSDARQKEMNEIQRLIIKASSLYDIAKKDDFSVTPSEVDEQLQLFKEAYPDLALNRDYLERALVVEKYVRQNFDLEYISVYSLDVSYAVSFQIFVSFNPYCRDHCTAVFFVNFHHLG